MIGENPSRYRKKSTELVRVFDFAEDIPEDDEKHFDRSKRATALNAEKERSSSSHQHGEGTV